MSSKDARSPHPSAPQQLGILVKKQIRLELQQPRNLIFRTILGPLLCLIYSAGFLADYNSDAKGQGTDFETFPLLNISDTNVLAPSPPIWLGGGLSVDLGALQTALDLDAPVNQTTQLFPIPPGNETLFKQVYTGTHFESLQAQSGSLAPVVGVYVDRDGAKWSYSLYASGNFIPRGEIATSTNPRVSQAFAKAGLLSAQRRIDSAIANVTGTEASDALSISLLEAQHLKSLPKDLRSNEAGWLNLWLPGIYLIVGLQFAMNFQLSPLIAEKRKGIVRAYVLLGVDEVIYWFQWVVVFSLSSVVSSSIITVIFLEFKWLPLANAFLLWMTVTLSLIQLSAFAVLIPVAAPKEELAAVVPFMLMLLSGGIYIPVLLFDFPFVVKAILSVVNPYWSIFQGLAIFREYDWVGFNSGVTFENAWESGVGPLLIIQVGSICFLCTVIYLYFRPPKAGILSDAKREVLLKEKADNYRMMTEKKRVEDNSNGNTIVSITGLMKEFSTVNDAGKRTKFKAVDGLNLDIARGEVFGLLGHNGSGKTTTISMLAGEFLPDAGIAEYTFSKEGVVRVGDGHDSLIRSKIGVCPQENLLFDYLTAREHLQLFARIKGGILRNPGNSLDQDINIEVNRLISELHFSFEEDADKPVHTFSGGMKRKLSIAIALIGDPEVLFLDEPTAGVDVMGRAKIWEMVERAKKDRGVVLTTHFMDEADLLCDRIGIINHGKVVTSGSSLFLKSRYGVGYTLSYVTKARSSEAASIEANIRQLLPNLQRGEDEEIVSSNGEKTNIKSTWRLPQGKESSFPELLNMLDSASCEHVSLNLTTLEQVFLRIGGENANLDDFDIDGSSRAIDIHVDNASETNTSQEVEQLVSVWKKPTDKSCFVNKTGEGPRASTFRKIFEVGRVVGRNSRRDTASAVFGVGMPLMYLIAGFAIASTMTEEELLIVKDPYKLGSELLGAADGVTNLFFGVPSNSALSDVTNITFTAETFSSNEEYFQDGRQLLGGFANETLFFNSTLVHSLPICQNIITNFVATENPGGLLESLTTNVVPMPFINFSRFPTMAFVLAICLGMGFMSLAFILIDIALLRDYELFTVFNIMGVKRDVAYVGIAAMNSALNFVPFFALASILAVATSNPIVGSGGRWLAFIVLMITYAWAVTPFSMMFEPLFPTFAIAKDGFPFIWVALTVIPFVLIGSLQTGASNPETFTLISDILSFIPPFTFQRGFFIYLSFSSKYHDPQVATWERVWGWETRVSFCILMLFVVGAVGWIVVYLQSRHREAKFAQSSRRVTAEPGAKESNDQLEQGVREEVERAYSSSTGIRARSLEKVFRIAPNTLEYKLRFLNIVYWIMTLFSGCKDIFASKFQVKKAVRGVSFGVAPDEMFVLLGKNGAGKTTMISMIVRELVPNNGQIILAGQEDTSPAAYNALYRSGKVGYCAQKDTIFNKVTVKEHLQLACGLRGLNPKHQSTKKHVDSVTSLLGLKEHLSKNAEDLSGGFKRKLCLAMSLIGFPEVVVLDEPTTGIDPAARAEMHKLLKPRSHEGVMDNASHAAELSNLKLPAMILSTHNMEEAQAMATRVGIMDNGAMVAAGSVESLQERFCEHNVVEVTFGRQDGTTVADTIVTKFEAEGLEPQVTEKLSWRMKLNFAINQSKSNTLQLANLFRIVESFKEECGIEFYSVNKMGLEQIFVNLSSGEDEEDSKA